MPTPKSNKILHLPAHSTPAPDTHHAPSTIASLPPSIGRAKEGAKVETRNRKPRCDSPLNCLSDDRQAALMDFMRTHTLDKTVEHLAAEGLKTNSSSLCIFRAAY